MSDVRNDLATGLVSYWSLDEASGTRYDAHASNNLTENGTGGVGTALVTATQTKTAGTGSSSTWTNPGNITSDDGSNATVSTGASELALKATNFGFTIPDGATITKIEALAEYSLTQYTPYFWLIRNGSVDGMSVSSSPSNNTFVAGAFSGGAWYDPDDTYTPEEINGSDFGVAFLVDDIGATPSGSVDQIQMRVTYTYSTGKIGNSADFESGDSDYLSIADASQTGLDVELGNFTISLWFKAESLPGSGGVRLAAKRGTDKGWYYDIDYVSAGTYRFNLAKAGVADMQSSNVSLSTGTWYHVVAAYDNTTKDITYYLDGSTVSTALSASSFLDNVNAPFQIGAGNSNAGTPERYFDGLIDEFGIWNTALTSGNVTTLYNSGNGIPYLDATTVSGNTALATNLVSYWEMEETSGTRYDEVGNNDLTANGTVTSETGKQGNAASFDRENTEYLYIEDANQTGLDLTGSHTINMWIKRDSADWMGFYAHNSTDTSGGQAYYNVSNQIQMIYDNACEFTAAYTLTVGTWYMLTFTYNVSTYTATAYANGVYLGSDAGTAAPDNPTTRFHLGTSWWTGIQGPFNGGIDEVGFWSRVLTVGEISALYNAGTGIPYASAGASGPASLKTWNTIAKANIKTLDTIAIASVKTINTIT